MKNEIRHSNGTVENYKPYAVIAADFNLWDEYFGAGEMTEAEFDALTIEQRVAMMTESEPELSPVALTEDATDAFIAWCEQIGCVNPPSDVFQALNAFNADGSSHVEVTNGSGNPDVYTFTWEDYLYA